MMKIRKGMFETNSSSTHTIVVADRNCEPGNLVDFRIGEFGWEFERLDTIDEKASYLYTMACELTGRDVYQDLYEVLVKYGIECSCSLPAVIKKYDGFPYLDNGYVDHAGEGRDFVERMLSHEHALIRYLFSPGSFVITGNDNCDEEQWDWVQEQLGEIDYDHHVFYKGN